MRSPIFCRLFWTLAASSAWVVALHWACGAGLRSIRTGEFGAFNRIAEGRVNAELLIAGSSRATLHYDPAVLARLTGLTTFNAGRIGSRCEGHLGVLEHYLRHNRAPRLLIYNADLNSLGAYTGLYDPPQYTPYLSDPGMYQAISSRHDFAWKLRYLPLYGYTVNDVEFRRFLGLKALFGLQPREEYRDGFLAMNREWNPRLVRSMEQRVYVFEADAAATAAFQRILAAARKRSIPVIVVLSPVHQSVLRRVQDREALLAGIARTSEGQGAIFWDYSELDPVSNRREYFKDQFHLNGRGAAAFSEALGKRLAEWLPRQPKP